MLAMGSSLRVSTWAPESVAKRKSAKLVIVNLQWTPLDGDADMKINARTDEVLSGVCKRLGVEPMPQRELRTVRYVFSISPSSLFALRLTRRGQSADNSDSTVIVELQAAEERNLQARRHCCGRTCHREARACTAAADSARSARE